MSDHISKYLNKFLVISDTAISDENDEMYAFGPVVKELEFLQFPDQITWIGFRKKKNASHIKITDNRIETIALNPSGGKGVINKLKILFNYPIYFFVIIKQVAKADKIHVRAPSNPAVITMLLSYFFPNKQFWFKYAGNWKGKASPFYKLQRRLLMKLGDNSKVTVNGTWDNQPKNVYGFENPCLDEVDRKKGEKICETKQIIGKVNYCFVGGMNTNKGVDKIITLLETLDTSKLNTFHFVGGGPLLPKLKARSENISYTTVFHGYLAKEDIVNVYADCHFIVLPSNSEGFPKVIGEAMNYGCVPLVSKISCIDQYIQHKQNGLLINPVDTIALINVFQESLNITNEEYRQIIKVNYLQANKFTYSYYQQKVLSKIYTLQNEN